MPADVIEVIGVVARAHGQIFDVECELDGKPHRVVARRNGKMSLRHVRVVAGDRVRVEISTVDRTRGRIVWRLQPGERT